MAEAGNGYAMYPLFFLLQSACAVCRNGDFAFKIDEEIAALMTVGHSPEDRALDACGKIHNNLFDQHFIAFHVAENHGGTLIKTALFAECFEFLGVTGGNSARTFDKDDFSVSCRGFPGAESALIEREMSSGRESGTFTAADDFKFDLRLFAPGERPGEPGD